MQNDLHMEAKPRHRRHHRFSEKRQIQFIAGFFVIVVIAVLVAFLWWVNRTPGTN